MRYNAIVISTELAFARAIPKGRLLVLYLLAGGALHAEVVGDGGHEMPDAVVESEVVIVLVQAPDEEVSPDCQHHQTSHNIVPMVRDLHPAPIVHPDNERDYIEERNGNNGVCEIPWIFLLNQYGYDQG